MTDGNTVTAKEEAEYKGKLRLSLLKDKVAAQANAFDQIDLKTGVALGFTFVVVGQVLASVFRIATDQSHIQSTHPRLVTTVFVAANCLAAAAIVSGIVARWPRGFSHGIDFNKHEIEGRYEDLLKGAIDTLSQATIDNQHTNSSKGKWALATHLLVGVALIAYLGLTVILYTYSIPNSNQKTKSVAASLQLTQTKYKGFQQESDAGVRSKSLTKLARETPPVERETFQRISSFNGHNKIPSLHESEIERKLKTIIIEQLQVNESEVTPNANFKLDLGADDLDVVELVMQVEEAFNLEIPDRDAKKLATVKDMVSYIEQRKRTQRLFR